MRFSYGKKVYKIELAKNCVRWLGGSVISPTHCTELCTVFQLTKRRGPYPSIRGTKTTRPLAIKPRDSSSLAFNEVRFRLNIRSFLGRFYGFYRRKDVPLYVLSSIGYVVEVLWGQRNKLSHFNLEFVCSLSRGPHFHNHFPWLLPNQKNWAW